MLTREQTEFFLVKAYNDGVDIEVNLKSDRTPITLADCESHTLIKSYLGPTHIPLLSEEGRDLLYEERRNWDLFWMVDPLDGTKEFIKGNGEFTVNIALMYNNRPEIGVIYVPYIHKMYFAIRGVGSFRKTEVLPDPESEKSLAEILEGREPLVEAANEPIRIAVSRSHNTDETFEHISRIKQRYPSAVVIQQGSSYKFCLLAEAVVDVYVRTSPTSEWDTAAGEVILLESGGRVENITGGRLDYNKETLRNPHFICKNRFWRD